MSTWLLPIVALAAGVAAALVLRRLRRRERSVAMVSRRLLCPACGEVVEVEAVRERRSGYFTGVASCRAPGGAAPDACAQACVQALNARAASRLAARSPVA